MTTCFAAPVAIVSVVGLIRTYGIGLIAGPAAGIFADKLKSPSKSILIFFAASVIVLAAFMIMPREASMVIPIAVLVVVLGFVTYGAFSIGSSPLTEAKVPMSIFGTASGLLSVIGFLPDTFVHTWFGGLIDAQGAGRLQHHLHRTGRLRRAGLLLPGHDAPRHEEERRPRRSPPTSVYLPTPAGSGGAAHKAAP